MGMRATLGGVAEWHATQARELRYRHDCTRHITSDSGGRKSRWKEELKIEFTQVQS
jgi:hypothetical protein